MLVVTVEIWPGGDQLRRHVIGTLNAGNVSHLAEVSDYLYSLDGGDQTELTGHVRDEGAWELIRKILEQEKEEGHV